MNLSRFFKLCNAGIILLLSSQHVIAQADDTTVPSSLFHDEGSTSQQYSLGPGTAGVLVFFVTASFLTCFIFIYLRHCSNRRFLPPYRANSTSIFLRSPSMPHGRGLDPAVLNTFPTFLYSQVKGHRTGPRALECAVCLLEFEDDHILRLLPKCNHVFHKVCIDVWLALHDTCPVCRANLVPKPGELSTHLTSTLCCHDSDSNLTELNSPPAGWDTGSGSVDLIIDIIDTSPTPENQTPNYQNRPPRSTPMKPKKAGNKLHRSHSTGHSIVQPGDNCERFTLRLPEDVRSQLMKESPSSDTTGMFLSVRSPRKGYRSSSVGTSRGQNYERFHDSTGRSGGWNFRMTPAFLSETGSVRSPGDDLMAARMNLMRSIKSPLDRLFRPGMNKDDGGHRSTSRLIPDGGA